MGNIKEIETIEYKTLAEAVAKACRKKVAVLFALWSPVADRFFVGNPLADRFPKRDRKHSYHCRLLCCEFIPSPVGRKENWTEGQRKAVVRERFGEDTEAVMKAFTKAYPELDSSYAAAVDRRIRVWAFSDAEARKRKSFGLQLYFCF